MNDGAIQSRLHPGSGPLVYPKGQELVGRADESESLVFESGRFQNRPSIFRVLGVLRFEPVDSLDSRISLSYPSIPSGLLVQRLTESGWNLHSTN